MIGSNAVVSVYAMINGTSTNTYSATATLTGVEAYIESQGSEISQVLGEQNNLETFEMYCDPIAIAAGDKVVDDRSREYRVIGVERHEANADTDDLLKVTMRAQHDTAH
jgi:hypothetical protein